MGKRADLAEPQGPHVSPSPCVPSDHSHHLPCSVPNTDMQGQHQQSPCPLGPWLLLGPEGSRGDQGQEERGQAFVPWLLPLSHGWQWLPLSSVAPTPSGAPLLWLQLSLRSGNRSLPRPLQDWDGHSSPLSLVPGAPPSPVGPSSSCHPWVIILPLNSLQLLSRVCSLLTH